MRLLFILILLLLGFLCRVFALNKNNMVDTTICAEKEVSVSTISLRFGKANIFIVAVENGDSLCKFSISDLNGRCIYGQCEKTPILEWAFDSLNTFINTPDFIVERNWFPSIDELSLTSDGKKSIISTFPTDKILWDDGLEKKIEELKFLLLSLWSKEFFAKYGLESFHFKKKSVQLRFGYNNVFTVRIEEGDSLCNLTISDKYGRKITKEWEKVPILEWTFDNMEKVIGSRYSKKKFKRKFKVKRNVSPGISELTMFEGDVGTVLTHYANDKIVGNDELDSKITELKTLLHNLWEREFYAKYGLELFLVAKS